MPGMWTLHDTIRVSAIRAGHREDIVRRATSVTPKKKLAHGDHDHSGKRDTTEKKYYLHETRKHLASIQNNTFILELRDKHIKLCFLFILDSPNL